MNEPIFQAGGLKRLMAYLVPFAAFFLFAYFGIQAL